MTESDPLRPSAQDAMAPRLAARSPSASLQPDIVPPPPRPSQRANHPMVVAGSAFFTALVLLIVGGAMLYLYARAAYDQAGPLPAEKTVNIQRGNGMREVAELLHREGVIDDQNVFMGIFIATRSRDDLKAGEYSFPPHASIRTVLETIAEGKTVQYQLTIPEGLTSEQIVARMEENTMLTGSVKDMPKEGTLLPETYKFTRGTTREQVIQRMQQAQRRVLGEVWDKRNPDSPVKTPEQLVILASIIEKETGKPEERPRVASVFINRLNQKMKLQSDPTIIYGLVGGKATLGRGILASEIRKPTPYNTYVIEGLPPGPIANPGRAALEAVANPLVTKDLYFVADGTGGHVFSETLDEHNRNVARWRQIEQDRAGQGALIDLNPASSGTVPAQPQLLVPSKDSAKDQERVGPGATGTAR